MSESGTQDYSQPEGGWADEPKSSAAEDDLGRVRFATMVARRIAESNLGRPSTVFGLVGAWGSGKSSLLNMIRAELPEGDWAVADFAPWSALDSASLTSEFLNTLASAFGEDADSEGEPMRDAVLKYSRVAIPLLSMVPIAGSVLKDAATAGADLLAGRPSTPWHLAFTELAKKVAAQNKRVLIIADDIDRLDPEELMVLLRVIRLLGRFENVHYLLAYDQDTIEGLLTHSRAENRTASFMEKIVQYPFEVPPMAQVHKRRLLNEIIRAQITLSDSLSQRISAEEGAERERRALDLMTVLLDGLQTPRAFARFHHQLTSYADLVGLGEVDVLDFIAVSYLRIFHHSLWSQLPRWKDELMGSIANVFEPEAEPRLWAPLIEKFAEPIAASAAVGIMNFLFKSVAPSGKSYFSSHTRAFDSAQYFERYLLSGLADDDVSDVLVNSALDALVAGAPLSAAGELASIIDGENLDRSMLALEKCIRIRGENSRGCAPIATFLKHRLANQNEGTVPSFDTPMGQLNRWASREVLLCLQQNLVDIATALTDFGEEQAIGFLYQSNGNPRTRELAKDVAPMFLDHVLERIRSHLGEILTYRPRLSALVDLAVFAGRRADIEGILDPIVDSDADLFARCVESFGHVNQWVGSGYSYEIGFRKELYEISLSETIRSKLAPDIHLDRELTEIATDDLAEWPPDKDVRDFARATAKALSVSAQHDSEPNDTGG